MFPREQFEEVHEPAEFKRCGRVVEDTIDLDILEENMERIYDAIPQLAELDVLDWECYDDWGTWIEIKYEYPLGDFKLCINHSYCPGEPDSRYWSPIIKNAEDEIVEKTNWLDDEALSDYLEDIIENGYQPSLF